MSDPFVIRPASPQVDKTKWGRTDLPDGKMMSISEFEHNEGTKLIELMGVRVIWSRMAFCPCSPANDETQQPDPTCTKCKGRGVFYFGPPSYEPSRSVGTLTTVQKAIMADDGGAVIRALIQRGEQAQNPYNKVGNWVRGDVYASVRWENLLGYYDRLVMIDSDITFSETVELTGSQTIPLRYRATGINTVQSTTARYESGVDVELDSVGRLQWIGTPPSSGRVTVHYCMHPTYLVTEHPHVIRSTPRRSKQPNPVTPHGSPQPQPVQAKIELEFLPKHDDG